MYSHKHSYHRLWCYDNHCYDVSYGHIYMYMFLREKNFVIVYSKVSYWAIIVIVLLLV